ncbi:DUF134 domain-containing protein [Candidatus Formimonas warabiya]|uniref:UPF0251 protein DCMF_24755 n=1 Tax=Formimonas warabiya TaxID=1761012 RepID=A0A3G1KYH7_FORW1|nr:hypothetical protein DCMF_24755 [Candidatus Formimonas warabiya]
MPRPIKPRRISFVPEDTYFIPLGKPQCLLEEVQIKVEELEAMRLKDIENLSQEECAEKMQVSRQTFQLIIDAARRKMAEALTGGKAIRIQGGNYTLNICRFKCRVCGQEFNEIYEKEFNSCPKCQDSRLDCVGKDAFCPKRCRKKNSHED